MIDLSGAKVLVTGASSMIGRAAIKSIKKRNATAIPIYHQEYDLLDYYQAFAALNKYKPDYCVHLAGYNGNIGFNKLYPADIFYNTTTMGLNTLKACSLTGVKKVVSALASCAYRSTNEELKEGDFWHGLPDESVEAHGLSKKAVHAFSKQVYKQHGTIAVCTIFNTAYGPHDSFNIHKTKVVGALIKKFVDAAENNQSVVECWGTGNPRRELIYCDDAAEGVIQTLEKYSDVNYPINIGYNRDTSIKELAKLIAKLTGYKGEIRWDINRPDGQFRKILDSTRMKEYGIDIKNRTTLEEGLEKTIQWYKENK